MNPYQMRYVVYRIDDQLFLSSDLRVDQVFWGSERWAYCMQLQSDLSISAVFEQFPQIANGYGWNGSSGDRAKDVIVPTASTAAPERVRIASERIARLLGLRRLTLPELVTLNGQVNNSNNDDKTNSDDKANSSNERIIDFDVLHEALQWMYLQQYIIIQPAIQRDSCGRYFCVRCLQTSGINDQRCGACDDTCKMCSTCADYGQTRSCLPMLELQIERRELEAEAALGAGSIDGKEGSQVRLDNAAEQRTVLQLRYPHSLTAEQREVSEQISRTVLEGEDCLVWAVCGAGKTELIFETVFEFVKSGKRVLLATPRKDVVHELLPRFREVFVGIRVLAVYGGSQDKYLDAEITIATTHQLLRYRDRVFDLVIIDEIDAFPYAGDQMLMQHSQRVGKRFIQMTATPDKTILEQVKLQTISLVTLFHRHHHYPLPEPEWIQYGGIEAKGIDRFIQTISNRFSNNRNNNHNNDRLSNNRPKHFLSPAIRKIISEFPDKGVIMLFVPSIAKGKALAQLLGQYFRSVSRAEELTFVYASDPNRERKIADLRAKKYRLIITTTILERGVTIPDSHVIVVDADHAVFTKSTLIQIAGRVGRKSDAPKGRVVFVGRCYTQQIASAIKEIRNCNRMAASFVTGGRDNV